MHPFLKMSEGMFLGCIVAMSILMLKRPNQILLVKQTTAKFILYFLDRHLVVVRGTTVILKLINPLHVLQHVCVILVNGC